MKTPIVSGKELIKLLTKKGFVSVSQKGSHVRLKKYFSDKVIVTVVPLHKQIDPGTLLAILRQCELTKEELFE